MWVPFSQVFGSVVFPLTSVVTLYYAFSDPQGADRWLLAGAWGLIPLGLLFGVLPHALWGLFYRTTAERSSPAAARCGWPSPTSATATCCRSAPGARCSAS